MERAARDGSTGKGQVRAARDHPRVPRVLCVRMDVERTGAARALRRDLRTGDRGKQRRMIEGSAHVDVGFDRLRSEWSDGPIER